MDQLPPRITNALFEAALKRKEDEARLQPNEKFSFSNEWIAREMGIKVDSLKKLLSGGEVQSKITRSFARFCGFDRYELLSYIEAKSSSDDSADSKLIIEVFEKKYLKTSRSYFIVDGEECESDPDMHERVISGLTRGGEGKLAEYIKSDGYKLVRVIAEKKMSREDVSDRSREISEKINANKSSFGGMKLVESGWQDWSPDLVDQLYKELESTKQIALPVALFASLCVILRVDPSVLVCDENSLD
jgi:hypothetical protein